MMAYFSPEEAVSSGPARINFVFAILARILWASMRNTPMVLTSAAVILLQWYLRSVMAHRLLEPDKEAVREGIDRLQLRGAPEEEIQAFIGKTLEQQPSVNPNLIPTWLLVVAFLVNIAGVVLFFAAVYVRFFL